MSKKHKHDDHEEHMDESWLIPYADLLTLLLALFIVLFAMSSVDAKKFQDMSKAFSLAFNSGTGVLDQSAAVTTGTQMQNSDETRRASDANDSRDRRAQAEQEALREKEQHELEQLRGQLEEYIENNGLTTQLEAKLNHSQLLITISDTALFASGRANLTPDAEDLGVAIGTMLKNYPGYEITVGGHTDNQPISTFEFASNYELSAKRAINFMQVLIRTGELDPKMVSSTGYGEFRPVATNDSVEGRAKNRRVEVSIIRKFTDASAAQSISPADAEAEG